MQIRQAVQQRVTEYAVQHESAFVRDYMRLLLAASGEEDNLLPNSSLEIADGDNEQKPKDWVFWAEPAGHAIKAERTTKIARTGVYSYATSGLNPGGPIIPAAGGAILPPGKYGALIHYYVPEYSETDGEIQIGFLISENGTLSQPVEGRKQRVAGQKGRWESMWYVFETGWWVNNPVIEMVLTHWNFKEGEQLFIDDVALYKLD